MARGGTRSIVFPPEERPRLNGKAPPEGAPIVLHEEPGEGVLTLGEMLHDVAIIEKKLKSLPFAGVEGYRGDLRVILGAANRLCQRSTRLLGEENA